MFFFYKRLGIWASAESFLKLSEFEYSGLAASLSLQIPGVRKFRARHTFGVRFYTEGTLAATASKSIFMAENTLFTIQNYSLFHGTNTFYWHKHFLMAKSQAKKLKCTNALFLEQCSLASGIGL